jgi:hypothetical protein
VRKLSKTQLDLLDRMANGAHLTALRPYGVHRYWKGHESQSVRQGTVDALVCAKLIERDSSDWRWLNYTITEAGRAALTKAQENP